MNKVKTKLEDAYDSLLDAEKNAKEKGIEHCWILEARNHVGYAIDEINKLKMEGE